MKRILIALTMLICSLCIAGCSQDTANNDKITVYTSFHAMHDFTKMIAGDKANVGIMCPAGVEPHDYEPTAKDIARLYEADVFVYNGMGMEHWTDSVIPTLPDTVTVICATDGITEKADNPHVWLNPDIAYMQMESICNALIMADSGNSAFYKQNLKNAEAKIDMLISDYEAAVGKFEKKDIIVTHSAYTSLCDRFGLVQIPINPASNIQDPSPQRVAEIEKYITDNSLTHIYKDYGYMGMVAEIIAADTGTKILALNPFEGIGTDDYFTVMYNNLEALKAGQR